MPNNDILEPRLASERKALQAALRAARTAGKTIGLVPTMGALHAGHLSLVRHSVAQCDYTVATIFVNPTQFGPQEDFSRYPRTLSADLALLAAERTDLVFCPSTDQIYPSGFSTFVEPPDVARPWEGACRPSHFRGVATVVLKLFNLIAADVAFFGQKDYQQSRVIQDMARDLDLGVRIEICPTIREPDGLAMSSRNRYMNMHERTCALGLSRALERVAALAQQGQDNAATLCEVMRTTLLESGVTRIDYVALVDPQTLASVSRVTADTMALIAGHVGNTRLIDNRRIGTSAGHGDR